MRLPSSMALQGTVLRVGVVSLSWAESTRADDMKLFSLLRPGVPAIAGVEPGPGCRLREYSDKDHGRKRLVILGTGWGSYSVLRNINKKLFDVSVVSPRNHFLFTPLLASTAVGTLEFRSIIEPVRNVGFRNEHDFHLSRAVGIDSSRQTVNCVSVLDSSLSYEVPYDVLVIGVGAESNTFGIPGVQEHAYFLKEVADARRIRNQILTNFELASHSNLPEDEKCRVLHTVIVGGGPTGVEFSAELHDFLQQDLERLYPDERNTVRITLIEAHTILSSFDAKMRSYTEQLIAKRKRMKIIKASVTKVTERSIVLDNGQELSCGMVVWSTGVAPRDFVRNIDLEKSKQGQVLVDDCLRVVGADNVYALGDCASPISGHLPCTAQVAERQGRYLAKSLSHVPTKNNPEPKPFVFKSQGMLAYVGDYRALADTPIAKSQGFHSWILWRSAYTTRLGSWRLRMQVPIDWTKTFFFGRDTSRF